MSAGRRRHVGWVALAALVSFVVGSAVLGNSLATAGGRSDVQTLKALTARYHSIGQAERAGYGQLADKNGITCIDDPMGAMGTHFVNGTLVTDGKLDADHPELLLYDRTGAEDRLMGVEYVIFASEWTQLGKPKLFGAEFTAVPSPNRYGLPPFWELHVWLWQDNPTGMFMNWNPAVHC